MGKYFIAKILITENDKIKYEGFYVGDSTEYYGIEPEISVLVTDDINLAKVYINTTSIKFDMYHESVEDYVSGDIISTFADAEAIDVIWIEVDRTTKKI